MSFEDVVAAELPEPRDDEPESLRRDILDELADHLACSYRRELLTGADAESALRRAFERFGNPAAVARRLWFDAMKGRIMSQRILVAACVLMAVSCVALVGMTWLQSREIGRMQLAAAIVESHRMAASEAIQNDMLKQLQALTTATEAARISQPKVQRASDWIPLKLKFVSGTLDGPPVAEVSAELKHGVNAPAPERFRESDSQGLVDFGVVQPGDWKITVVYSAEGQLWRLEKVLNIPLGGPIEKTIVCPKSPRELPVEVRVQWPPKLAGRGFLVLANFAYEGSNLQADFDWSHTEFQDQNRYQFIQKLLVNANGRPTNVPQFNDILWTLDSLLPFNASSSRNRAKAAQERPGRVFTTILDLDEHKQAEHVEFLQGRYRLTELEVLRPSDRLKSTRLDGSFEVLARTATFMSAIHQFPDYPNDREHLVNMKAKTFGMSTRGLTLHRNILDRKPHHFVASPNQPNVWTIDLPPELVEVALDALKRDGEDDATGSAVPKPKTDDEPKPKG